MTADLQTHAAGTYASIRSALLDWNWDRAEVAFRAFCTTYRANIPEWFEDEYVFNGMKLWAAGRPAQLLRHYATFLDRASGETICWRDGEGEELRVAATLLA